MEALHPRQDHALDHQGEPRLKLQGQEPWLQQQRSRSSFSKMKGPLLRTDLSICTANVTAWGFFKKWFDGTPDEHKSCVYLLQETRILGQAKVREANAWCLARGVSSHFCEAVATEKGGVSAHSYSLEKAYGCCSNTNHLGKWQAD